MATLGPVLRPSVAPARVAPTWACRVQELVSAYLPMLLMLVLALATWWLVKNTPVPGGPMEDVPKRHEPDYQMQGFDVQRFDADGRLRTHLSGRELRHYPDNDTLEIDDVQLRTINASGEYLIAKAQRGLSNADGSEVQLMGEVRMQRFSGNPDTDPSLTPRLEIQGEFVHVYAALERLSANRPVRVTYPGGALQADGLEYDNLKGVLELKGRSRMQMSPKSRAALGPGGQTVRKSP